MKNARFSGGFRPVEEWKSALMVLPDLNFLQLMRSVFGNIKTPFNKQRLLDDLFVLLSRDEIRKTLAAYLDEQDHRIIAAIALLNEPTPGELRSFFTGEFSYVDLHALLVNLEERLILYRLGEDMRLALNPVLEPVLSPLIADQALLFPSFPAEKTKKSPRSSRKGERGPAAPAFIPDGRFLASLFAFVSGEDDFFKTEGGIRKKIIEEGKHFFPDFDLELAVGALRELGLFKVEGEAILGDDRRIKEFSALSVRERGEYWAAGIFLCLHGDETVLSGLSRNRVRGAALFIHRFCLFLDPRRRYPQITLRRFAELLGREDGGNGSSWGGRVHESKVKFSFEHLLDTLLKTGILEEEGELLKAGPLFVSFEFSSAENAPASGQPVIAMDTSFSFLAYPEIPFADALALARFCALKPGSGGQGAAVCFELTRASVVRGFDRGLGSEDMLELLGRLSGSRLDESLNWTLKDWEKRYTAVALHQGLVLTLAEDMRYLAGAEPVASLINRTLAPGIYLIGRAARSEAAAALRKAGVDIIAQPPLDGKPQGERQESGAFFSSLKDSPLKEWASPYAGISGASSGQAAVFGDAGSIKEKFRRVLGGMKLSKPEKDELSARIERRLVLSETQLKGTLIKYEKLEARGLDYIGKAAIAKQAIASGSLVEVSWPEPGGGTNRATGIPSALEKKDGESVLILKSPPGDDGGKEISILLAKISLIRRIKQSIFET